MKKYKLVKISNSLYGKDYNDIRKDFIIEKLKDQIEFYKYYPERLKEEMNKLEECIRDYNFVGMNKECYAYRVAKEKLELIKSIYFKF